MAAIANSSNDATGINACPISNGRALRQAYIGKAPFSVVVSSPNHFSVCAHVKAVRIRKDVNRGIS